MDHIIFSPTEKKGKKNQKERIEVQLKDFVKAHESFFFLDCTRTHTHALNEIGPLSKNDFIDNNTLDSKNYCVFGVC